MSPHTFLSDITVNRSRTFNANFSNFSWYTRPNAAILLRQVLAPFESINSGVLTKSKILMLTVL